MFNSILRWKYEKNKNTKSLFPLIIHFNFAAKCQILNNLLFILNNRRSTVSKVRFLTLCQIIFIFPQSEILVEWPVFGEEETNHWRVPVQN